MRCGTGVPLDVNRSTSGPAHCRASSSAQISIASASSAFASNGAVAAGCEGTVGGNQKKLMLPPWGASEMVRCAAREVSGLVILSWSEQLATSASAASHGSVDV